MQYWSCRHTKDVSSSIMIAPFSILYLMFNIQFSFTALGRGELVFSSDLKLSPKLVRSGLCIKYMKLGLFYSNTSHIYTSNHKMKGGQKKQLPSVKRNRTCYREWRLYSLKTVSEWSWWIMVEVASVGSIVLTRILETTGGIHTEDVPINLHLTRAGQLHNHTIKRKILENEKSLPPHPFC